MGLEEAERRLTEQRAKVKQLQAEEATANDFATYDEYWNSCVEASRKERLEEERVLEQRVKEMRMTLEQLQYKMKIEDPQRFVPRGFLNLPPPCDCEGKHSYLLSFFSYRVWLRSFERLLLFKGVDLPHHSRGWGASRNARSSKSHTHRRPAHRRR